MRKNIFHGFVVCIAFGAIACDMSSGTGGKPIEFQVRLLGARAKGFPPGAFDTSTGWHVELEQAFVALGPVYVYQNPPPLAHIAPQMSRSLSGRIWDAMVPSAHAHAGDEHFNGGEVKGEWLAQTAFDVLNPNGMRAHAVPGTQGRVQSLSIWMEPPRTSIQGSGDALHGHNAYVVGRAEKEGSVIAFEGGLDIEDEGTKRRVDGIPLDMQLDDGAVLTLVIHPAAWFDGAHFDRLTEKNDIGRFVITPQSQVRTAWFLGARGFAAFSVEANEQP